MSDSARKSASLSPTAHDGHESGHQKDMLVIPIRGRSIAIKESCYGLC